MLFWEFTSVSSFLNEYLVTAVSMCAVTHWKAFEIKRMEFSEPHLDMSESDSLGLSLMLDPPADKNILGSEVDSTCQQAGDLCKEFSPSSSECPFANLPLFGECGLELSQDCGSDISETTDSTPEKNVVKQDHESDSHTKTSLKKKRKKMTERGKEKNQKKLKVGEKPFKCPVCNKSFSHNSNATTHLKRHGDKPFKCQECDKRFALSVNYEAHMRFHNGIKPYKCEQCGKSFSWSGGYHRHQRIHSGVKPYICTDCGKEFSDIGNYNNHRRIHTGERPHVCRECGKGFSRSDSLNRHMITHSHVKMFECTQCGQEFKHLESLNKHCKRVHDGLKPLKRDECLKPNHNSVSSTRRGRIKD